MSRWLGSRHNVSGQRAHSNIQCANQNIPSRWTFTWICMEESAAGRQGNVWQAH
jgi:hypothetical protein